MTHSYYPIALDLKDKPCLVVGGGALATEKVEGLLRAGARITVVNASVTADLASLAEAGEIKLYLRSYHAADLDDIYLAYGATDSKAENALVAADAREAGVLVNAVDDIPNCDFFAMAIVRRGDLQVAISTNGLSPAFARWTREYLDAALPDNLGEVLAALAEVRRDLKSRGVMPPYERWQGAIDDEVNVWLGRDDGAGARERVQAAVAGPRAAAGGRD